MNRRDKQISIFDLCGGGVTTRCRVILLRRVRFENRVLLSKKKYAYVYIMYIRIYSDAVVVANAPKFSIRYTAVCVFSLIL